MNNRKPRNKRGKISRQFYAQEVVEKPMIESGGKPRVNPRYPGKVRIIHMVKPPTLTLQH